MRKARVEPTLRGFLKDLDNNLVSFEYPIQRKGEQWDPEQKSTFIHSLAGDYPVPPLYAIEEEREIEINGKKKKVNVLFILDGKQRSTNVNDFINLKYPLHDELEDVEIYGEKYQLAKKWFNELDPVVQDAILDFKLDIVKLENATDEEIEEIFFRLNNGTPLSKQQKAKAKMGSEWAEKIQSLVNHEFMKEKASFTKLQLRRADDETAIIQTMMLIDNEYDWKSLASNEVFDYSQTFRGNTSKFAIVEKIKNTMDYLNKSFDEKEKVLLKKVHFPMVMLTAMRAMEMGIHPARFSDWIAEFKKAFKGKKAEFFTKYKMYTGDGSIKEPKVKGRIEEMRKHLETYFAKYEKGFKADDITAGEVEKNKEEKQEKEKPVPSNQKKTESKLKKEIKKELTEKDEKKSSTSEIADLKDEVKKVEKEDLKEDKSEPVKMRRSSIASKGLNNAPKKPVSSLKDLVTETEGK
ncbi:DUF262 domain-containing protein [Bacillus atrophaeus]|uniref:DUF262 domain-containing protein n=1 Tax=Bacillus atrophaeus TaxID=1452 RepID=UPI00227E7DA4|nr:DUF262 domain-containing protein [Bacillus atrophaeus]MCY7947954.1 DUF262 domain-containing protein [Bacillus atrophaeus]MCY8098247.1 DUF262 domain-containing protein [Bacillus atrophaeus]MCY9170024.1 DUF262 domain-containing protein [Bacillus atrophaeus]MEC0740577.1 DUF262 domain-containing protein [Bacillus atrophaeus]MEC0746987.1 DUF262 domain-containing protein [Bacillus atrophaeus]